jgi:hypothetical protein
MTDIILKTTEELKAADCATYDFFHGLIYGGYIIPEDLSDDPYTVAKIKEAKELLRQCADIFPKY